MMLAYNLFLLFKMDFAGETEYRQQIKTFRLKYIFLAGKIGRRRMVTVLISIQPASRILFPLMDLHSPIVTKRFVISGLNIALHVARSVSILERNWELPQ